MVLSSQHDKVSYHEEHEIEEEAAHLMATESKKRVWGQAP